MWEDVIDLPLDFKFGLLAIICTQNSENDTEDLPKVLLTSNKVPWDPKILKEDESYHISNSDFRFYVHQYSSLLEKQNNF